MPGKRRQDIKEAQVQGLKYFQRLLPMLERLHHVGCEGDKAGNRKLHYDQYCALILLFLFNPIVSSLRGLVQASELRKVQRKLGCPRASLGSLSEAVSVFAPERLEAIIAELGEQLEPVVRDGRIQSLGQVVTAVDGTLLKKLPTIASASLQKNASHRWKLHAHFEVLKGVPRRMDLTGASGRGDAGEKAVLRRTLEPDRLYVADRGYEQFSLFNAIVAAGSGYVVRIRNDRAFTPECEHPISDEAAAEGVLEDAVGRLGSPNSKRIEHPDHPVRLVRVKATPHPKRGGRRRASTHEEIVLATNRLDVPPEVISLIYQYRWQVEIFFRFFKHVLGCRHLLSERPDGIAIQTYCAIIACLLLALTTGRKPTLRTYEMVCYYFTGLADEEELLAHLEKLPPQDA